jgi:NADPH-dependent curcumin reductase CurA
VSARNRQWLLKERPTGRVDESCFEWTESDIPSLADGEFSVRNLCLSFDPTQRGWMTMDTYIPKIPLGEVMYAASVGQVVESRHPDFAKGDLVQGAFGWQDYAVTDGGGIIPARKLPPGTPPELALSLFGITGLTAYFGVLDVGQPEAGETFVVSGAAGATGAIAGMIAKERGCRVVGIAGGPMKCDWLTKEAGFDAAIDYKSEDVGERLSALCPDGIDVYFDNVGGDILNQVLARIAFGARIVLCGAISRYELDDWGPGPGNYFNLIIQRGRMEGFIVLDYAERFPEAIEKLTAWLKTGKIKNTVDLAEGLENAPATLQRLFSGANFGKQLLRIAQPS